MEKKYKISFEKVIESGAKMYKVTSFTLPTIEQLTSHIIDCKTFIVQDLKEKPTHIESRVSGLYPRWYYIDEIISVSAYELLKTQFYECMYLYTREKSRVEALKEVWNGTICMTQEGVNVEYREYNGVSEHKHENYDWGHPVHRIHKWDQV